jgi:hypothetical protein
MKSVFQAPVGPPRSLSTRPVVDGGANRGDHSRPAGIADGSPPAVRRGLGLAAASLLWLSAAAGRGDVVTGLTAYWSFNSTSSPTTTATVGPNGTLVTVNDAGGSPFVADTPGVIGNSLDFVSTQPTANPLRQGYVAYGTTVSIQSTMSIAGWMNIDAVLNQETSLATPRAYLLGQMGAFGDRGTQVYVEGGGVAVQSYVDSAGTAITTGTGLVPIGTNAWTHIAATRISGTQRIYVDGILRASGTATGPFDVSTQPLASGRGFATSGGTQINYLDAQLDDLGLWSSELTSREVAAIAGLGKQSAVPLNSDQIDDVLALNAVGQSAVAGSDTWYYTTTFVSPLGGGDLMAGMNYVGTDNQKYVILEDTEGSFVGVTTLVPEPQGLLLAGLGVAAAAWAGRRRRP